jgi:hypothetical protein
LADFRGSREAEALPSRGEEVSQCDVTVRTWVPYVARIEDSMRLKAVFLVNGRSSSDSGVLRGTEEAEHEPAGEERFRCSMLALSPCSLIQAPLFQPNSSTEEWSMFRFFCPHSLVESQRCFRSVMVFEADGNR